jgi:hypothetical protein
MKRFFFKQLIYTIAVFVVCSNLLQAQTGNVGVGTTTPGSKLTVNGSFAAAFRTVTATTFATEENDHYITWNGTAAGTVTLPASTSGTDRTGRLYYIKNTSALYTLTIDGAGSEMIDNAQTVLLQPGESALLVKTNVNTASGITWEVVQISRTQSPYYLAVAGGAQTYVEGTPTKSTLTGIEYSTNGAADFNTGTSVWTCPQTGTYKFELEVQGTATSATNETHASIVIVKNGTSNLTSQLFFVPAELTNSGSVTHIGKLNAGDQISVNITICSSCATDMVSNRRRLEITRL